jgi:prepilin-type N-terminal cleavage/methylation domain-containing protein
MNNRESIRKILGRTRRFRPNFSLIELLVVIAIIAILASMLLPALRSAKEITKRSTCAGNMKQLYYGAAAYTIDHDEYLPKWSDWTARVADAMGMTYTGTRPQSKSFNQGLFMCPSTIGPGDVSQGWNPAVTYNGELFRTSYGPTLYPNDAASVTIPQGGWQLYYQAWNNNAYKRLRNVTNGSVLLIEKALYTLNWSAIDVSEYNRALYTNDAYNAGVLKYGTHYRHLNSANFLFKEGHILPFKQGKQFTNNWVPKE